MVGLQLRDIKEGIAFPGGVSLFSGERCDDETPKRSLWRELREELEVVNCALYSVGEFREESEFGDRVEVGTDEVFVAVMHCVCEVRTVHEGSLVLFNPGIEPGELNLVGNVIKFFRIIETHIRVGAVRCHDAVREGLVCKTWMRY